MKKIVIAVLVLAAVGFVFMTKDKWIAGQGSADGRPVIKIGVSLPLSGDVAYVGKSVQKAIELSLRDIEKGEKLKYDYELLFEDDGLDNKKALMNYERFKSIYDIKAMFSVWTNSSVISSKNNSIIHMGCSWGYETAEGLYNFNHSTLPKEQIDTLIGELKKRDIKKIGILHNPIRADEKIVTALQEELSKNDIEVVFNNSLNIDQKDFRVEILKMKDKPVDIVFVLLLDPSMGVYMKQAKELGYNPQYTTFDYFSYNPEMFEGFWYVRDAVGGKEFVNRFTQETGESIQACVSNMYDGLKIVVDGFEKAPIHEGRMPELKDVAQTILETKNLSDATGKTYIDAEGNIHAEPTVEVIKDGQSVVVGE